MLDHCYDAEDICNKKLYASCPDCLTLVPMNLAFIEHGDLDFRIAGVEVEPDVTGVRALFDCPCGAGFDIFVGRGGG